jgi:hypothetical protein
MRLLPWRARGARIEASLGHAEQQLAAILNILGDRAPQGAAGGLPRAPADDQPAASPAAPASPWGP